MDIKERGERYNVLLGKEIRASLKQCGVTFEKMAEHLETNYTQISRYVNGKRAIPAPFFFKVCALLEVDPAGLVERTHKQLVAECGEWGSSDQKEKQAAENVHPESTDDISVGTELTATAPHPDSIPDFKKAANRPDRGGYTRDDEIDQTNND